MKVENKGVYIVDRVEPEEYTTTLDKIRDIAQNHAKDILFEIGLLKSDQLYAGKHYELQYTIYHAIKETLKL